MSPERPAAGHVLDASALLALLKDEPGSEAVEPLLGDCAMSTVSWAEVLQRYASERLDTTPRLEQVVALGVEIHPFGAREAELAADLHTRARDASLGIADRACLALALDLGATAVTADRAWAKLDMGVRVEVIR